MNDRIHACLDGELPREALTAPERAQLEEWEAALEGVAAPLRAAPAPDLAGRVMARLPAPGTAGRAEPAASAWDRALRWLWAPRTLRLQWRPAYALAATAVLLLLPVGRLALPGGPAGSPALAGGAGMPGEAGHARLYVQFRLDAPEANRVELAGSFTGWQPAYELRETAPGVWSALVPLEPGVHDYTFVVDGEHWRVDPNAPQVADDFGGLNSRLFLPSPGAQA